MAESPVAVPNADDESEETCSSLAGKVQRLEERNSVLREQAEIARNLVTESVADAHFLEERLALAETVARQAVAMYDEAAAAVEEVRREFALLTEEARPTGGAVISDQAGPARIEEAVAQACATQEVEELGVGGSPGEAVAGCAGQVQHAAASAVVDEPGGEIVAESMARALEPCDDSVRRRPSADELGGAAVAPPSELVEERGVAPASQELAQKLAAEEARCDSGEEQQSLPQSAIVADERRDESSAVSGEVANEQVEEGHTDPALQTSVGIPDTSAPEVIEGAMPQHSWAAIELDSWELAPAPPTEPAVEAAEQPPCKQHPVAEQKSSLSDEGVRGVRHVAAAAMSTWSAQTSAMEQGAMHSDEEVRSEPWVALTKRPRCGQPPVADQEGALSDDEVRSEPWVAMTEWQPRDEPPLAVAQDGTASQASVLDENEPRPASGEEVVLAVAQPLPAGAAPPRGGARAFEEPRARSTAQAALERLLVVMSEDDGDDDDDEPWPSSGEPGKTAFASPLEERPAVSAGEASIPRAPSTSSPAAGGSGVDCRHDMSSYADDDDADVCGVARSLPSSFGDFEVDLVGEVEESPSSRATCTPLSFKVA